LIDGRAKVDRVEPSLLTAGRWRSVVKKQSESSALARKMEMALQIKETDRGGAQER
jgi:hypothetical protein